MKLQIYLFLIVAVFLGYISFDILVPFYILENMSDAEYFSARSSLISTIISVVSLLISSLIAIGFYFYADRSAKDLANKGMKVTKKESRKITHSLKAPISELDLKAGRLLSSSSKIKRNTKDIKYSSRLIKEQLDNLLSNLDKTNLDPQSGNDLELLNTCSRV